MAGPVLALVLLAAMAGPALGASPGQFLPTARPGVRATAAAAIRASRSAAATAPQARHGTVVSFTWGGGLADQMGALPTFRRYRMHATFYVPSGLVCQPAIDPGCTRQPYLTLSDVRRIAAGGNEIGGLSVEHVPLNRLPAAEAQREICDDRLNLTRWGFQVTDFAYPFALVNRTLQTLTQRCGYSSGLGTGELRGAGLCTHCPRAETIPPRNPYLLRAPIEVSSVGTRWTAATFEQIVAGARSHGGGWIIFTIHDVCARSCSLGVTIPELASVLGWLARQSGHGVRVETIRQVIGGPVRPVVAGPEPPPVPAPGVVNSRLTQPGTAGLPACFQTTHYGANHAVFRYRRQAGPAGAGAEFVTVTQRKSGTAQFLPTLDLGACAPAVSAGSTYTIGAWYKATTTVAFNVYYRTSLGTWKYWTASPPIPAVRRWSRASWTPPAVPAGAKAISFSLAPMAAGTVATSRYSLAPDRQWQTAVIILIVVVAVIGSVGAGFTISDRVRRRRRAGPG